LSENSGADDEDEEEPWYEILVNSGGTHQEWTIRRSYSSLYRMDRQLHSCIFDRSVSRLPEMRENLVNEIGAVVCSHICCFVQFSVAKFCLVCDYTNQQLGHAAPLIVTVEPLPHWARCMSC